MKYFFRILSILFLAVTLSPRAAAEGAYFGVRGEALIPLTNSLGGLVTVPLFGVQVGYDFGAKSDPGFSVRGSLASLIVINRIGLDVFYRIPQDATGKGLYVGGGADLLLTVGGASFGVPIGLHAVFGYALPLSDSAGFFVEAYPGLLIFGGGPALFYVSVGLGVNFYL